MVRPWRHQRGAPALKKKRLVNSPISFNSASATNAETEPITIARPEIGITRGVIVKSPVPAYAYAASSWPLPPILLEQVLERRHQVRSRLPQFLAVQGR